MSTAVKDIYNLTYDNLKDKEKTTALLKKILSFVKIISVTEKEIFNAFDLNWKDFEDAVQYSAAVANNIDAIITRNMKGFSQAEVKILTPEETLYFIGG